MNHHELPQNIMTHHEPPHVLTKTAHFGQYLSEFSTDLHETFNFEVGLTFRDDRNEG